VHEDLKSFLFFGGGYTNFFIRMVLKEGRRRACSRAIWQSEVRHDDCLSTDLPVLEILSDDSTLCDKKKSAETARYVTWWPSTVHLNVHQHILTMQVLLNDFDL
jgi:hypothetical protein